MRLPAATAIGKVAVATPKGGQIGRASCRERVEFRRVLFRSQSCPVVSDVLSFDIAAEPNAFTCCHCNRESGCRHSEGWSVVLLYCARQCGGMAQILLKRVVVPGKEITHDLVRDDRCLHIEAGELAQ